MNTITEKVISNEMKLIIKMKIHKVVVTISTIHNDRYQLLKRKNKTNLL